LRIDAHDGVLSAIGEPGRAIGALDYAVRCRLRPELDLSALTCAGIEDAKGAIALGRVLHFAIWGGCHVMRIGAFRQWEDLLRLLRGSRSGKREESQEGDGTAASR
jgi:hypothetical protein